MVFNKTAGRTQYTGAFAALAKMVQNAAQGGMVLLSQETKEQVGWAVLCMLCWAVLRCDGARPRGRQTGPCCACCAVLRSIWDHSGHLLLRNYRGKKEHYTGGHTTVAPVCPSHTDASHHL